VYVHISPNVDGSNPGSERTGKRRWVRTQVRSVGVLLCARILFRPARHASGPLVRKSGASAIEGGNLGGRSIRVSNHSEIGCGERRRALRPHRSREAMTSAKANPGPDPATTCLIHVCRQAWQGEAWRDAPGSAQALTSSRAKRDGSSERCGVSNSWSGVTVCFPVELIVGFTCLAISVRRS
jgi:hypothetical protein